MDEDSLQEQKENSSHAKNFVQAQSFCLSRFTEALL